MQYRRDIDGIRAIAVIAVVLFHAFPNLLPGGFIGVDIFFVLSGYLISFHIISELQNHTFKFFEFYARRIRRIFPALTVLLIFCLIFGWYFFLSTEYQELGLHVAAGAGFVENFIYWRNTNYFDTGSIQKPLLHLWSLGIEEQFYILWPCALWLAYRLKLKFLTVILSITFLSFLCNIFSLNFTASATYFLPQNRFWELGIGGLCAWWEIHATIQRHAQIIKKNDHNTLLISLHHHVLTLFNRYSNYCAGTGLVLLLIGFTLLNKSYPFPGWWALLPTVGTALIIIAGSNAYPNRVFLSHSVLVKLGLISYPLYLWHWTLLTFAFIIDLENYTREVRAGIIVVSIIFAWITYYFIEKPIRRMAISVGLTSVFCLLMLVIFLSGLTIYRFQGFPERAFPERFQVVTEAFNDWGFPGSLTLDTSGTNDNFWRNSDNPPQIAFIGDSHIEQFAPRISHSDKWKNHSAIFITDNGCPPIPNVFEDKHLCENFIPRILNILRKFPSIQTVVIGGCWNCYFLLETEKIPDKNNFDYYFLKENLKYKFRGEIGPKLAMESLQSFLTSLANKYNVFLLLDNPLGDFYDPRSLIGNRFQLNGLDKANAFITINAQQKALNDIFKNIVLFSRIHSIDQLSTLCPNYKCLRLDLNGIPIYKDNHHLRPFFIKNSADYIDRVLDSIVNK